MHTCGICKQSYIMDPENGEGTAEFAEFKASWGYWSNRDLISMKITVCESCSLKIEEFIKSIGGKIEYRGYGPYSGLIYNPETDSFTESMI